MSSLTYNKIPPPGIFPSIRKRSLKPFAKNWIFGKLLLIFVLEIISKPTCPLIFCMRTLKVFLIKLIFKCATTTWFKASNAFVKATNSPLGLREIYCHWNTFEISPTKLLETTLVPLLFKWSLNLFRCCGLILSSLSI